MANINPQTAYSAFIFGEQHRYTYFLRTLIGVSDIFKPLDDIINDEFIPALIGNEISSNERMIISLPIKDGGLGLRIYHETANICYFFF